MLDYKLLEAFVMVLQEGGFEKAAKKLFLTQSAVSQRVKQLEEQVGQVLLIRTSPPQSTDAGRQCVKHFKQVEHLEADLNLQFTPQSKEVFTSLAIGVNADSLSTWFLDCMQVFLKNNRVVLDLHLDDQEETYQLFREGKVQAYIGTQNKAQQGCRVEYLGSMEYKMMCTPEFRETWFQAGVTMEAANLAPVVIFSRKDRLHEILLNKVLSEVPVDFPVFYIPSPEKFVDIILQNRGYGMIPVLQSKELSKKGILVDLLPESHVSVDLYWHSWSLQMGALEIFSKELIQKARSALL